MRCHNKKASNRTVDKTGTATTKVLVLLLVVTVEALLVRMLLPVVVHLLAGGGGHLACGLGCITGCHRSDWTWLLTSLRKGGKNPQCWRWRWRWWWARPQRSQLELRGTWMGMRLLPRHVICCRNF